MFIRNKHSVVKVGPLGKLNHLETLELDMNVDVMEEEVPFRYHSYTMQANRVSGWGMPNVYYFLHGGWVGSRQLLM